MTMRSELDHLLACHAQALGADVRDGCGVDAIRMFEDRVEIVIGQRVISAKFVIAGDGATSALARAAGWPTRMDSVPALECEVFVSESQFARFSGVARFDFDLLPHGYAWVFPKQAHLSIGVLSVQRGRVNLPEALERYLKLLGLHAPIKLERHGYVIPIQPRRGPLAKGRVILAGDAAGLVDPVTAEGLTHAIVSGRLAAESILDGKMQPVDVAARYQHVMEHTILRELKIAAWLARLLYQWPRLSVRMFRKHGNALSEAVTEIVMGKRSYAETADRLLKRMHVPRLCRRFLLGQ